MLKEGESLAGFVRLSREEIMLHWLSCELMNAGTSPMATKFTKDLSDSEILTTVRRHIDPDSGMLAPLLQTNVC
jgi:hypothetical protein